MSFLKRLFGLSSSSAAPSPQGPKQEYSGYEIEATPTKVGHEFQIQGIIRELEGEKREHHFIRADKIAGHDEAIEFIFRKGKQIIDQMGPRMFS
ncbi:MAG: HlyU family transcriptional regulator [Ancalomicrobiaceae bacterium]|nr:HlyU family transcriptional regulator [Ancalomicrobiaceae bacterium]